MLTTIYWELEYVQEDGEGTMAYQEYGHLEFVHVIAAEHLHCCVFLLW